MSNVYLEEFLYRGRCPDNEADMASTYHVVLGQFATGPDGKASVLRAGPMTPTQATAAGFPLDKILGAIAAQALLDRDAAQAEIATANAHLDDASKQIAALTDQVEALQAPAAEEPEPAVDTGPSNPLLHALTFGLAGN